MKKKKLFLKLFFIFVIILLGVIVFNAECNTDTYDGGSTTTSTTTTTTTIYQSRVNVVTNWQVYASCYTQLNPFCQNQQLLKRQKYSTNNLIISDLSFFIPVVKNSITFLLD